MIELESDDVEMDSTPKYLDCAVHMFGSSEAGKKIEVETVDAGSAKGPARSSHQYWLNCWYHEVSEGGNTELVSVWQLPF
ncbi:hypothetical protein C5167_036457 [Papaver somniferum]|uniref:Uncharacterized protein n=1 Tax=Papaver somniferum TaxID=3469 RepID=A0A4Y7I792_PAPSO|nr:hypothetical protein C5167_036457 [Papaver somniferum]